MTAEERYRLALVRIANAQSGVWGRIAREALYPKPEPWRDEHCGHNPSNCPYGDACADCRPVTVSG